MKGSRTSSLTVHVPLVAFAVCVGFVVVANAGLSFKLPIPVISFYRPGQDKQPLHSPAHPAEVHHHPPPHPPHSPSYPNPAKGHHRPHHPSPLKLLGEYLRPHFSSHSPPKQNKQTGHKKHPLQIAQHSDPGHRYVTDHTHQDQDGRLYLHDPDSTVKFYYKENLLGPSNRVDIHTDACREVPMDYWYQRPKSLWAKHCITLYANGQCKGEGVQVAGGVAELRSAGMHYGVNSFKPCEKNIRIRFMSSAATKHKHHHLH